MTALESPRRVDGDAHIARGPMALCPSPSPLGPRIRSKTVFLWMEFRSMNSIQDLIFLDRIPVSEFDPKINNFGSNSSLRIRSNSIQDLILVGASYY